MSFWHLLMQACFMYEELYKAWEASTGQQSPHICRISGE